MNTPFSVEILKIPSSIEQLSVVDEVTERIAREMGFTESDVSDLAICVTEAVNNAIVHAHHNDEQKAIKIHFERRPDGLLVRVLDEGEGFNPNKLADPTLPENIMKDGGRGIHVMRHLMDKMELRSREKGMEVVILKLKGKGGT